MKIAILGYGSQGKSALEYYKNLGHEVVICDKNTELKIPEGVKGHLGESHLKGLSKFDLIVRSPIVHPRDIISENTPAILERVTSSTNEFMRVCPTKNIIGVTGTKGKGTTSTLITKILEASGKRVHLGGNIGTPPLELLKNQIQADDWVVLELANFQLIDLNHSPKIAVCLMVVPEHLDWHHDFAEYIDAKRQLFRQQSSDDIAVYFGQNETSAQIASISNGWKVPYFQSPGALVENGNILIENKTICSVKDVKLLGKHNLQNICAAITATWQITKNISSIKSAIVVFNGMKHRLELVAEVNEVKYYDDSLGTTPETAIAAIDALPQPKILILGGSNKGATFDELAHKVNEGGVKHVVCIGDTASLISDSLRSMGYLSITEGTSSMKDAVEKASKLASSGDAVLLSPACASFGMFQNYKDRGEQFKSAVLELFSASE